MPDTAPAIVLNSISKVYRLYESPSEQALDVFGLSRVRFCAASASASSAETAPARRLC
jgi:hypothetical protein